MKQTKRFFSLFLLVLLLVSAGCSLSGSPTPAETPIPTNTSAPDQPLATNTPEPPPTEVVEMAAMVNGESIRKSSYDASLMQLQAALTAYPDTLPEGKTPQDMVIEQLVNRALLAQAARDAGYIVTDEMIGQKLAEISESLGGQDALNTWLDANGYTEADFRYELGLELEAAWQREQITAAVPTSAEQVRAQQILFYDYFQATRAYDQLSAGYPFDQISAANDPNQLGYLDWFPRGFLLFPELEETAFSLGPGQYSSVIETDAGYHILYVYEKGEHPLSSEARLILQEQALADWLTQQNSQSQIEILVTP